MSMIYMIRHGQASFGKADYDCLSDLGVKQAGILTSHLSQAGIFFDAIYTGLQLRHEQTLAVYLDECKEAGNNVLPIKRTDAFNEYDSEKILTVIIPLLIKEDPAFEAEVAGMIRDNRSFQKVFEKVMSRWIRGTDSFDGLESWKTYSNRVCAGIDRIMESEGAGKNVAVFTSGGPIAASVQKTLNLAGQDILKLLWQIVNSSVTRFKYGDRRLSLFGFNDFSHLELTKDRTLITYR
jgi:broad specificity phosphatase PhoE